VPQIISGGCGGLESLQPTSIEEIVKAANKAMSAFIMLNLLLKKLDQKVCFLDKN
jgi:hypothetical protein